MSGRLRKVDSASAKALREKGLSYAAIGVELGVSGTAAFYAVNGYQRRSPYARDYRNRHLATFRIKEAKRRLEEDPEDRRKRKLRHKLREAARAEARETGADVEAVFARILGTAPAIAGEAVQTTQPKTQAGAP